MVKKFFWFIGCILILSFSIVPALAIDEVSQDLGKLAIIGADYNIYTYDFSADDITQLTTDADMIRRYEWVTWSNDGRLAYFCCQNNPEGQAFVSSDGVATPELVYTNPGAFIIYASWSPADCGVNCRELAMLVNSAEGLAVDIFQDSDTPSISTIGTGGPFYYHWDSTGTQMIFHRGNRDLDIYNRTQNDISSSLAPSSGQFQAPVWSPVDDRVLIGLQGSQSIQTNLAVVDGDEVNILVEDLEGLISFLWSPDGRYIAYRTVDQFGIGGISVIDANTGEAISVADNSGVVGFFWSPDSSKIAYISFDGDAAGSASVTTRINNTFAQDDSPTRIIWNVLDLEAQTNTSYASFVPTYQFVYLMTYFEQFAPSHRLWSPDSRYLVFSGTVEDGQQTPMVYTVDTTEPTLAPSSIAEGVFGIWSFN